MLEQWGWPRAIDRTLKQFIVDRTSSYEPVGQPVLISQVETRNMLDFYSVYDVVTISNSDDWKGILCTCFSHLTYGCCAHSICFFLKLGGTLSHESRRCEPSIGLCPRGRKGKVKNQLVSSTIPAIREFIPDAAAHNPGRGNAQASSVGVYPVGTQADAPSSSGADTVTSPVRNEQPSGESEFTSHDVRQAPRVVDQASHDARPDNRVADQPQMHANGSTMRPRRTQSSSVYRR